ncbi:MAG TPA: TRAP transporter substrate-binding protein [Desulfatiglandales bacterium]|nr:TRAP transporter substrate-binding protein [Desulfatiglandales bacterium]
MKKWKQVGLWMVFAAFSFALFSGAAGAQEKKITAKLGDLLSPDHPHTRTWVYFAERVKEKTKGRVEVQVFHSGQLGNQKDMYLGMQTGSVEMAKIPFSVATEWIPECKVFDLPYLFNSRAELLKVYESPYGKKFFNEKFLKQGLVGLTWVDDGVRSIYTHKPVRKPEDMKGLKIRTMSSDIMLQTIKEMGGIPNNLSWGELYLALQQKVLDGAENCPVLYYTSKHWEVCKVFSLTEQFWVVLPMFASKKWWDTLPQDTQTQIREAALDAEKYFVKIYSDDESKAIGWLKEKGVQVVTDVDKPAFEKKVQPVYDDFVKKYGKDLLEGIKAAAKKK